MASKATHEVIVNRKVFRLPLLGCLIFSSFFSALFPPLARA